MVKSPVHISFKIPIYSVRLYLFVGHTSEEVFSVFKAKKVRTTATDIEAIKEMVNPETNEAFAMQMDDRGRFLIWLSKYDNSPRRIQALIHEITHTTINVFEYIGAEITSSSHEPLCYLHDYITGQCLKRLTKTYEQKTNSVPVA